jgi:transposase
LGINVRTVRKYVRPIEGGEFEPQRAAVSRKLDGYEVAVAEKLEQGLSAVQIYQNLCEDADFEASYETVKLEVRRLRRQEPTVYRRMQYRPGEEAQMDFGTAGRAPVADRSYRGHLPVMTLRFSRDAYYEPVLDQKIPTFLGALARGLTYFGGAPERSKPDNLRSAVLYRQLGEPYYQEDFFRFCRHYGRTRPSEPRPLGMVGARGAGTVQHFAGVLMQRHPLKDHRATDHVAAHSGGGLAVSHSSVRNSRSMR